MSGQKQDIARVGRCSAGYWGRCPPTTASGLDPKTASAGGVHHSCVLLEVSVSRQNSTFQLG